MAGLGRKSGLGAVRAAALVFRTGIPDALPCEALQAMRASRDANVWRPAHPHPFGWASRVYAACVATTSRCPSARSAVST